MPPRTKPAAPEREHRQLLERYRADAAGFERRANTISFARLVLFVGGAAVLVGGATQGHLGLVAAGIALWGAFVVAVVLHARTIAARDGAATRQQVHERHLERLNGGWVSFSSDGEASLPVTHAYAWDLDLVGPGSLFQRIDVTHTRAGEEQLVRWLAAPADLPTIRSRQAAVEELARALEFRQELEVAPLLAGGRDKLDADPFVRFTRCPSWFASRGWLVPLIHALPLVTLGLLVGWQLGLWSAAPFGVAVALQFVLSLGAARATHQVFDLAAARQGFAEAFARMLSSVEHERFEAPHLTALQRRLSRPGIGASQQLGILDRWVGFAELRHQGLVHLFVNPLLLWDLHVLWRVERWNRKYGQGAEELFEVLGEFEALASLATLKHGDPSTTFPEVGDGGPFTAEGIAHPLLPLASRVVNELSVEGPGHVLVVTGSNMAGKSTLLRAVGLNTALALAGGPVAAQRLRIPRVRLRASMRARDDVQQGASYFHAELNKLRGVIEAADQDPPILFLLDELLRGTNANARSVGSRAVVLHLLERGALGLVATHDVSLAQLEQAHPDRVANVHFTDVVEDGEMTFDYRLRSGIVQTSNALRLLELAGIRVPDR